MCYVQLLLDSCLTNSAVEEFGYLTIMLYFDAKCDVCIWLLLTCKFRHSHNSRGHMQFCTVCLRKMTFFTLYFYGGFVGHIVSKEGIVKN